MIEVLNEEQSRVLEWLHECEGLDLAEVFNGGRAGATETLAELALLGLAFEIIVDGELVGWIPAVKGFA